MGYGLLFMGGLWLCGFAKFWTFMVITLPQDLGPYSQMSSFSMFLHRAFPMRETNDVAFEYKFDHIIMVSCVILVLMLGWVPSRQEVKEKYEEKKTKSKDKGKKDGKSESKDTKGKSEAKDA